VKLFYVHRMPLARIDQSLIVRIVPQIPIWKSFRVEPTPGWASNARDPEWLDRLTRHIDQWGVRNPVLLWEYDGSGAVAPVKGASRLAACLALHERHVPALVSAEAPDGDGWEEIDTGLIGALSVFHDQPVKAIWYPGSPFYAEWPHWDGEPK